MEADYDVAPRWGAVYPAREAANISIAARLATTIRAMRAALIILGIIAIASFFMVVFL